MKNTFLNRWKKLITDAKENDNTIEITSGFRGLMPLLAILFGWLPALFGKPEIKEDKK